QGLLYSSLSLSIEYFHKLVPSPEDLMNVYSSFRVIRPQAFVQLEQLVSPTSTLHFAAPMSSSNSRLCLPLRQLQRRPLRPRPLQHLRQ
ncbi:hypothetical protein PFISCL1PPCAC_1777, partial [Pristionchus fissidentatus]